MYSIFVFVVIVVHHCCLIDSTTLKYCVFGECSPFYNQYVVIVRVCYVITSLLKDI